MIVAVIEKKELVGDFWNAGRRWCKVADPVLVHDWPQDAVGQAIPYGIYELTTNRGFVCVGDCFDTPRFAVEAINDWWQLEGCRQFPRWVAGVRQIVATVSANLHRSFRLSAERPHALGGVQARLAAMAALHNCCIWVNRHLDRPALAFADLVGW